MDKGKVYRAALTLWGADAQTLMAFEEMAELQKELCKHARGKDNREAIAEEIADVEIMLAQMKILHDCTEAATAYRESKLRRLAIRCGLDIDGEPEPVKLGPGTSFRLEKTSVSGPCSPPPELKGLLEVHINATPEQGKELWRMMQEAGPGMIVNLAEEDTPQGVETVKTRPVAQGYPGACVTIETPWGDGIKLIAREEVEEQAKNLLEAAARVWPEAKE